MAETMPFFLSHLPAEEEGGGGEGRSDDAAQICHSAARMKAMIDWVAC